MSLFLEDILDTCAGEHPSLLDTSTSGPEEGHTNWSGQEVVVVKENAPLIDVIKSCVSYSLLFIFYKQLWLLCKIKYMSYFQFCKIYAVLHCFHFIKFIQ